MKRFIIQSKIWIAALFFLALATPLWAQTSGYWTFDNDNEGFITFVFNETIGYPYMTASSSAYSATGGHEDGHIYSVTTTSLDNRLYAIWQEGDAANPAFGNLINRTIQSDFMREGGDLGSPSGERVLAFWAIADETDYYTCNMWLSKIPFSIDVNTLPENQWTPKSIKMIESYFFPWANCPYATKTFTELATSYKYIGISFLSDQITPNGNDSWNKHDSDGRFLHYGVTSTTNAIFRIDNFGPTDAMIDDFGDLPAAYNTTHAHDGARHAIGGPLMLGAAVQSEPDGQPSADATGDGSEEDGVTRENGVAGNGWSEGTVASGHGGSLSITISGGSGRPQVFIDFNGDHTLTEVTLRDASGAALTMPMGVGTHRVYFDIPTGTFTSNDNAIAVRVRLSSAGGLSASGAATDGEVEDYIWDFGPNAVVLSHMQAQTAAPAGLAVLSLLLAGLTAGSRQRRSR